MGRLYRQAHTILASRVAGQARSAIEIGTGEDGPAARGEKMGGPPLDVVMRKKMRGEGGAGRRCREGA